MPVTGGSGVQVDALADLVAQRARVVHQPRRAGQVLRAAGLGRAARRATPAGAPSRRGGRCPAPARRAASGRTSTAMPIRPERGDEQDEAADDPPPVDRHRSTAPACSAAATLLTSASHTTHCSPVSVASGSDSTHLRGLGQHAASAGPRAVAPAAAGRARRGNPASEPSRGWS